MYDCSHFLWDCWIGRGRQDERTQEEAVQTAYKENRRVYRQRKLKRVLFRQGWTVSRRRIGQIMKKDVLVSSYTPRSTASMLTVRCNEAAVPCLLDQPFDNQGSKACVVSDLRYVRIAM